MKSFLNSGRNTVFLPDIGTFFDNDLLEAISIIDRLADAGFTFLKGELLHDPDICLKSDFQESYYSSSADSILSENYRSLIERKVVSLQTYSKIFSHAIKRGLSVVVSVYDKEGAEFAERVGVKSLKLASSNITNLDLIRHLSSSSLPIIIDSGHSSLEEIARAINVFNDNNKFDLIVQHSPPAPPEPVSSHNLKFMTTLGAAFGLPFGLSDHHEGDEMLYAATAMGALVVEKGVCMDSKGDDQDRAHALNISSAASVLRKINNISDALGSGTRYLARSRTKYRARPCLFAKQALSAGDLFTVDNLGIAFPLIGVGSEYLLDLVGLRSNVDIPKGSPIIPAHYKYDQ